MNSAKSILENESFRSITFSNISKKTNLSRPSIYKYYKFPEEILANILSIEFQNLNKEIIKKNPKNIRELSSLLVKKIKDKKLMLKLLSLNFSIIEDNIRKDNFIKLKEQIFKFIDILKRMIKNINSKIEEEKIFKIQYSILTVLSSIYPITHDDSKHLDLIKTVNPNFNKPDYKELLEYNIFNILKEV
ncbi:TetR/AcrR family transcriptional regulator [Apilactobacillus micheneri]|uniref:TetR/AcrR family transcriptional regulator n=1 Tax=Apilactobacillus micheneri TaxID=1899430 RepID=UPI000D51CE53|nr:TetR/AcrR family transcriptional regulator [Apilactobacillus micheneri]GAY80278.1 hypothetical protein NBRC113063_01148 [Apilactobacillus micheneri]